MLAFSISHSSLNSIDDAPLSFGLQVRDLLFLFLSPKSTNIAVIRALSCYLINHFKLQSNCQFILQDGSHKLLKGIYLDLKLNYPGTNIFF